MSITHLPTRISHLVMLFVISITVGCSIQEPPANRYQRDAEVNQIEAKPVVELQNQALAALEDEQYQQAIDYLQRAIKIQPRNAWSWHYLAQAYWHKGQPDSCVEMIQRSSSYASDDTVRDANDHLRVQCQP